MGEPIIEWRYPETNGTDLRVKALSYVGFKAAYDLNHQEHKGKEKLFLVLFVCFVVPIQISQPVSIPMFTGLLS